MPKQSFEIRTFQHGVSSTPSDRDTPPEASAYELNCEMGSVEGQLKAIPDDESDSAAVTTIDEIRGAAWLTEDTAGVRAHRVICMGWDDGLSNGKLIEITDPYGTPAFATVNAAVTSDQEWATMVVRRGDAFIGCGPTALTQYYGYRENIFEYNGGTPNPGWDNEINCAALRPTSTNVWLESAISSPGAGNIPDDAKYYFGISYVYDGHIESPINELATAEGGGTQATWNIAAASGAEEIDVELAVKESGPAARVTHVKLYAASGPASGSTITTLYRLLGTYQMGDWTYDGTGTARWTQSITFPALGPTFESQTGFSETLERTDLYWGLSCAGDGYHFVGNVNNPSASDEDWTRYMVRSMPLAFASFDWSSHYIVLPKTPVAMAHFQGRIYAFSEQEMYRISPDPFVLEDAHEGAGCFSHESVLSTDHGLFWASRNQIWRYTGQGGPEPIGEAIMRAEDWTAFQAAMTAADAECKIAYDEERDALLVIVYDGTNWRTFAYGVRRGVWRYWEAPTTHTVVGGGRGEAICLSANGTNTTMTRYLAGSGSRTFTWRSSKLSMGRDAQDKFFNTITVEDEGTVTVRYATDDVALTALPVGGRMAPTGNHRSRWIQIECVSSGAAADAVESIGITYRHKVPK